MDKMNLFGRKGESSEALFNDAGAKSYKALFTNNGESSEAPFKHKQGKINITDDVINESAANNYRIILSSNNKLYFSIEDTKYIVDLYNEDARKECRLKLNEDTGRDFNWFREETGLNNWVLYDSKMYTVEHDGNYLFLHYIEDCGKDPIIPINASSCHRMFSNYKILTELDFNNFSTVNVIVMDYMFADSPYFEHLDLSHFNTENLRAMNYMFKGCTYLLSVKLDSFDTSNVDLMEGVFEHCTEIRELDLSSFSATHAINVSKMFAYCTNLRKVNLSRFNPRYAIDATGMFYRCENLMEIYAYSFTMPRLLFGRTGFFFGCVSLPSFRPENTGSSMARTVEAGGYFTTPSDLQLSNTSQINNILSQENTGMKWLNQLLKMVTL